MADLITWTHSATNGEYLIKQLQVLAVFSVIAVVIGMWKMFEKADKPGWAAIVPFYNTWLLAEMVGWPGWYGLFPLLVFIPFLGVFAVAAIAIALVVKLAEAFGESVGTAIALVLLAPVGWMVLGFGDTTYHQSTQ